MKPDHPVENRSAVEMPVSAKSDEMKFVVLSDEAAQAMLTMAETAATVEQSYVSQRQTLTAVNIAMVGAVLGYVLQLVDGDHTIRLASTGLLVLMAIVFPSFCWQLGAAEAYYHTTRQDCFRIVQRHFKVRAVHWEANSTYDESMGKFRPLLDRHAFYSSLVFNSLTPLLAIFPIWWA